MRGGRSTCSFGANGEVVPPSFAQKIHGGSSSEFAKEFSSPHLVAEIFSWAGGTPNLLINCAESSKLLPEFHAMVI